MAKIKRELIGPEKKKKVPRGGSTVMQLSQKLQKNDMKTIKLKKNKQSSQLQF